MTSPTYWYIRKSEGSDSQVYPEAYGPNDGLVSVKSAIWVSHIAFGWLNSFLIILGTGRIPRYRRFGYKPYRNCMSFSL